MSVRAACDQPLSVSTFIESNAFLQNISSSTVQQVCVELKVWNSGVFFFSPSSCSSYPEFREESTDDQTLEEYEDELIKKRKDAEIAHTHPHSPNIYPTSLIPDMLLASFHQWSIERHSWTGTRAARCCHLPHPPLCSHSSHKRRSTEKSIKTSSNEKWWSEMISFFLSNKIFSNGIRTKQIFIQIGKHLVKGVRKTAIFYRKLIYIGRSAKGFFALNFGFRGSTPRTCLQLV